MVGDKYILDADGNPVPEPDLLKWGMWFEHAHKSKGKDNRIVHRDRIGQVEVSTVFLGLDHRYPWEPQDKPILWETLIFADKHKLDGYMRRYGSFEDALAGHMEVVEMVKSIDADLNELERMMRL